MPTDTKVWDGVWNRELFLFVEGVCLGGDRCWLRFEREWCFCGGKQDVGHLTAVDYCDNTHTHTEIEGERVVLYRLTYTHELLIHINVDTHV